MGIRSRLSHAWDAFRRVDNNEYYVPEGTSYSYRPDRTGLRVTNERTIINSIITRLAIDVAAAEMRHIRINENGNFEANVKSGLNECLMIEANTDQSGRHLRQDIAMTLFDEGVCAIVPVETDQNPEITNAFDIKKLRVGRILEWWPQHIRVDVYDEKDGRRKQINVPKKIAAIVENPLFNVMNQPNSTLQRLVSKLNILDSVDKATGSGKLDIIIQLPYTIRSEARKKQAEQRRNEIEMQLVDSKYGIAYADGAERITQLNRPAENNLLTQIETLTAQLYSQLGLTEEIMSGTADEQAMLNYHNRTVEPIVSAITDAMTRSFLTKTARTQRQTIRAFRDPFKFVPVTQLAEIVDKFTRNEVASPNEFRGVLGWMPSKDPASDELRNRNVSPPTPEAEKPPAEESKTPTDMVREYIEGASAKQKLRKPPADADATEEQGATKPTIPINTKK